MGNLGKRGKSIHPHGGSGLSKNIHCLSIWVLEPSEVVQEEVVPTRREEEGVDKNIRVQLPVTGVPPGSVNPVCHKIEGPREVLRHDENMEVKAELVQVLRK